MDTIPRTNSTQPTDLSNRISHTYRTIISWKSVERIFPSSLHNLPLLRCIAMLFKVGIKFRHSLLSPKPITRHTDIPRIPFEESRILPCPALASCSQISLWYDVSWYRSYSRIRERIIIAGSHPLLKLSNMLHHYTHILFQGANRERAHNSTEAGYYSEC